MSQETPDPEMPEVDAPLRDQPESYPLVPIWESVVRPLKAGDLWNHVGWGALWGSIPLLGTVAMTGYMVEYSRRAVKRDATDRLPSWKSWEETISYAAQGWEAFVGFLIWTAVLFLISGVIFIPFIPAAISNFVAFQKDPEEISLFYNFFAAVTIPLLISCLVWLLLIHLSPILFVFYSGSRKFADLFALGAAWNLAAKDGWNFTVVTFEAFGIAFIIVLIASIIGLVALVPIVGWIIGWYVSTASMILAGVIVVSAFGEFCYKHSLHRE